jgi:galactarate dehydratase
MAAPEAPQKQPRYICISLNDNVAIVVNDSGLPAGTTFPCGLKLIERVPQGRKVALVDIGEGAAMRHLARPYLALCERRG